MLLIPVHSEKLCLPRFCSFLSVKQPALNPKTTWTVTTHYMAECVVTLQVVLGLSVGWQHIFSNIFMYISDYCMKYFQSDRLHRVLEYVNEVHSLCGVLGIDFGKTVNGIHPSLHQNGVEQSRNISNSTLEGLASTVSNLKAERKSRIDKVLSRFYSWFFVIIRST
jgi:hypothetical protein